MGMLRQRLLLAALFLQSLPSLADDVVTNVMSSIASYQYSQDVSGESLTNGGLVSLFVSYRNPENLGGEALTNGGISTPYVSYARQEGFDESLTNGGVVSLFVSFQYLQDLPTLALTNGGVSSPFVSYGYPENVAAAVLTNGGISSAIVSYQYFEWPGDSILGLQSSPLVSYFYLSGALLPGALSSFSQVTASPSSVPADGQTAVTITVRLLDGSGNPVAGKTVTISAVEQAASGLVGRLAAVAQPANPTDDSGRTTAQLTSATAGTVIISAQDATDAIPLSSHATAQFTSALAAPNDDLSQAIAMLYRTTADNLNDSSLSIAEVGTVAGAYGDQFRAAFGSDQAVGVVDALFGIVGLCTAGADSVGAAELLASPGLEEAGAGQLIEASGKASYLLDTELAQGNVAANVLRSVFLQVAKTARAEALNDVSDHAVEMYLEDVAAQPQGLSMAAHNNAQNCLAYQQALQQQAQGLAQGIPSLTAAQQTAWANDLQLRYGYSTVLVGVLSHEKGFLQQFSAARQQASEDAQKWLLVKLATAVVATAFFDGPGALLSGAVATIAGEHTTLRNMNADQTGYDTAFSLLGGSAQYASQAYLDAASAYSEISQALPANPVTGVLGPMTDWEEGRQASLPVLGSGFWVTKASSLVYVTNTSARAATFEVVVLSGYASSAYGVGIPNLPQVTLGVMQVGQGAYGAVPITYFDGNSGGRPDPSTPMTVYVLGNNGSGTFYVGSFTHNWNPTQGGPGLPGVRPLDLQPEIENPLSTYVAQNPTNQTYEVQIFVVNPFDQAYSAIVTQALPPGITVVTADGTLGDAAIVWTNSIAGGGLARDTFVFQLPLAPGASTNLPPATVTFVDQTNNASSAIPGVAPAFTGLFPVLARGSIPLGIPGADVPLLVTVMNWTATNQAGAMTISLTNSAGADVGGFSLAFDLGGSGSTNLAFSLPGTLPPGAYSVTGWLDVNGGTGQVFAGTYVMPPAPVRLSLDATALSAANGFTMVLQGPVGFDLLIEASTDLVDWQPIQYFVSTDPAAYFSDPLAANYTHRFYRAMAVPPPH